jgi:hypothetical protein
MINHMNDPQDNEPSKVTNPKLIKGILTSAIVAVCLSLLFGALTLYGVISVDGARIILAITWCIAVSGVLLSDVIWNKSRRFKIASMVIAAIGFGVIAWGMDTWAVHLKERHLTKEQIDGIGRLADKIPHGVRVMVRVPANSRESMNYGKEIWAVLAQHQVTPPLIIAAGEEPPVGLEILVRSELDPAGRAAEDFMAGMEQLHFMPVIHEGYWAAAENGFVIFVGVKPNYD